MAIFTEGWLEQLKTNNDIVEVINKFVYLEKKGKRHWACCPFHREKTPSFAVDQENQYYHCFGCGKSGNVITFVMEYERLTYPEAVEWLAKRAGMALPEDESDGVKKARILKEKALAALKLAARFYFDNLYKPEGRAAIEYINKRRLSDATVKEFGLGCSLDFYSLPDHLKKAGYDKETLLYAGIVSESNGRIIDFQAGRLIIPIINAKGQVIGFGGRTLDNTRMPKYKNTSATALFDKKRNLFGLNLIKKLEQKEKITSLILVEGYMDVISLSQAGIKNAIASMGTSLTPEQCAEIKKYTSTVYVSYDGDAAGQAATLRSLDLLSAAGLDVRVISMPEGLDPDDTVKKLGKDGYLDLMDAALPLIEFKLKKVAARFNLSTREGKNKYAKAAVEVLSSVEPITRDIYIKQVSEISGLYEDTLKNSVKNAAVPQKKKEEKKEEEPETYTAEMRGRIIAARFLLSSFFLFKDYVSPDDIKEEYFDYPPHKEVCRYIARCIESGKPFKLGDLCDVIPSNAGEVEKIRTAAEAVPDPKQEVYYAECLTLLNKNAVEKRKKELIELINTTEEGPQRDLLKEELRKLTEKKNKIQRM